MQCFKVVTQTCKHVWSWNTILNQIWHHQWKAVNAADSSWHCWLFYSLILQQLTLYKYRKGHPNNLHPITAQTATFHQGVYSLNIFRHAFWNISRILEHRGFSQYAGRRKSLCKWNIVFKSTHRRVAVDSCTKPFAFLTQTYFQ